MNDTVLIFDTTLRDGEQSPGATMNLQEKMRLARQLEILGVDILEAGFPASSQGDFEAVRAIANSLERCQVAGLCRASLPDINRTWEAIRGAANPRIHTFVPTSDIHLEYKLRQTRQQVLEMTRQAVSHAASLTPNIEFSAEDASRSDRDFLAQIVETAIACGATTINIPDTVGYAQPREFGELIAWLITNVRGSEQVVFSVHCHNDLCLGVANTLAGLQAGARQAEVTLTGIGERAGNTALEELVMALEVRGDYYGMTTNVVQQQIFPSCRLLSRILGLPIPPNKPVVGGNAFSHASGIHQAGMLKNPLTYEIMTPEAIGRSGADIVLGKHSGRTAFRQQLRDLGYRLDDLQLDCVFEATKRLADRKKNIFIEDVEAVVLEEIYRIPDKYRLKYLSVLAGNRAIPTAALEMEIDGQMHKLADFGTGPIDAMFGTIRKLVGRQPELLDYSVNAISGGSDAQGEVMVRLEENGRTAVGRSADADIIVSSAKAYINALNRLAKKETDQIESSG